MANGNITIEDLAGMIEKGFEGVDDRLDRVDQKLERIEIKLENIVYRKDFEELEERVKVIEEALAIKKQD